MKHTFSSQPECAHVWANLTQEEITAGVWGESGPLKFTGAELKSYGTVIGRHIVGKGNARGFLLNRTSYSNTTCKHQSAAIKAIGYGTSNVFEVRDCSRGDSLHIQPAELRADYLRRAVATYEKAQRSRNYRDMLTADSRECVIKADAVADFFGLRHKRLIHELDALGNLRILCEPGEQFTKLIASLGGEIKKQSDADKRKQAKIEKEQQAARAKRDAEKRALLAKYAPQAIAQWRTHQEIDIDRSEPENFYLSQADLLQFAIQTERGIANETGHAFNAALRLSEDRSRVETTQGAQVLVRTVSFLWAFCREARATQQAVSGDTLERFPRLDHYSCNEIDAMGNVRAGCHCIPFAEVESIARELGLPPFNGEPAQAPAIPQGEEVTT